VLEQDLQPYHDDELHDDAYQQPYWVKHRQLLLHDDEQQQHIDVDKMDVSLKVFENDNYDDDDYVEFVQREDEIPLMMNLDKGLLMMRKMKKKKQSRHLMNKQMEMDNKVMRRIQVL
jgi:hypothetical protein